MHYSDVPTQDQTLGPAKSFYGSLKCFGISVAFLDKEIMNKDSSK
jgi:hypothetical protein